MPESNRPRPVMRAGCSTTELMAQTHTLPRLRAQVPPLVLHFRRERHGGDVLFAVCLRALYLALFFSSVRAFLAL